MTPLFRRVSAVNRQRLEGFCHQSFCGGPSLDPISFFQKVPSGKAREFNEDTYLCVFSQRFHGSAAEACKVNPKPYISLLRPYSSHVALPENRAPAICRTCSHAASERVEACEACTVAWGMHVGLTELHCMPSARLAQCPTWVQGWLKHML